MFHIYDTQCNTQSDFCKIPVEFLCYHV